MYVRAQDYKLRSDYIDLSDKDTKRLIDLCSEALESTDRHVHKHFVKTLIENRDLSSLSSVIATLFIKTTDDVARLILHTPSFKYTLHDDPDIEFTTRDARIIDEETGETTDIDPYSDGHAVLNGAWKNKQKQLVEMITETYKWAVTNGISPREADAIIPHGLKITSLTVSGPVNDWIRYIEFCTVMGHTNRSIYLSLALAAILTHIVSDQGATYD